MRRGVRALALVALAAAVAACGDDGGTGSGSERHVAPPVDAELDGLTLCAALEVPRAPDSEGYGAVLYGDVTSDDPYDGPMLGVIWNPTDGDGSHAGDGATEPVRVRGQAGVAAPITVFQQAVLPELGTVIAWTEGDQHVGLYGRGWSLDRADELVALADQLDDEDGGGFRLPDSALPDGFGEVYAGDPGVLSLVLQPAARYTLQYDSGDGLVALNGLSMTADAFEAFRFLTVDVDHSTVAGRDVLAGSAWGDGGPEVVTWREDDGLVVRIVGLSAPRSAVEHVAEQSRDLTDDEWAALQDIEYRCDTGP